MPLSILAGPVIFIFPLAVLGGPLRERNTYSQELKAKSQSVGSVAQTVTDVRLVTVRDADRVLQPTSQSTETPPTPTGCRCPNFQPRRTLLTAAAAVAVSLPDSAREKLPIYPAPEQDIIVVETPTELERQIGHARRAATRVLNDTHAQVQGVIGKWIGIEQAVESRVKSLIAPDEPLTPGILYAGIAALSGSVLARTRGLPLRVLVPPTLFVLAAQQFIPKTSHNVATYAGELEERYTPGLAEKHAIGRAHFAMTVARAQEAWEQGRAHAGETVGQA
ncbi:hypothetical protein EVG20_g8772, partial [Dentipellis fragilis]